jgi:hypothetical protein
MVCLKCKLNKDISNFSSRSKEKYRKNTRRTVCNDCRRIAQNKNYLKYKTTKPFKCRCTKIKATAKIKKVPFNLTPEHLEQIWTGKCPISGVSLYFNIDRGSDAYPELDRLIPEKGYIIGNVTWISRKMNRIKNDSSLLELKQLVEWVENNVKG